jgi:Domain of unknown function (DUF3459)
LANLTENNLPAGNRAGEDFRDIHFCAEAVAYGAVNAAPQVDGPDSVFAYYRRLIELRQADPVVTDRRSELLLPEHPALRVFLRRHAQAVLPVAANLCGQTVTAPLPVGPARAAVPAILRTHQHRPARPLPDIELQPRESVVWRLSQPEAE